MGMTEQKPQSGMNIAPDGTIYEILEDGSIKRIGKVASNGEFEPFGGPKEGIRVRDGFIYRVINGKEQKIGRVLPNGDIESISQKIKSEAEISGNKVKIVAILSVLIAFIIGAGIYLFEEEQEAKEQRVREAKIAEEERMKDEEYANKIKPIYQNYLNETSLKIDKLDSYIKQLNNLLKLQDLKYEENKNKVAEIVKEIEAKKQEAKQQKEEQISRKGRSDISAGGGQAVIMGALDRSVIDAYIRRNLAKIRWCYEKELNKDPKLFGRIVINFIISATGAVSSSKVQRTTMGNATVESCVADQIKKIRFPAPKGGGIVIVNYPFVFKNSED